MSIFGTFDSFLQSVELSINSCDLGTRTTSFGIIEHRAIRGARTASFGIIGHQTWNWE